MPPKDMA
jgi:translation initiation factor 2 alpha subunit (eIF-2alpha)